MLEENTSNKNNQNLLFNEPEKFLLENQRTIKIIVNRFVKYGFIISSDRDEIIQFVNSRLLDGILKKNAITV